MTTMLEKAARALWTEAASYAVVKRPAWSDLPAADRSMALACARAVLMAVREPDQGIMDSAFSDVLEPAYPGDFGRVIDAILNEGSAK